MSTLIQNKDTSILFRDDTSVKFLHMYNKPFNLDKQCSLRFFFKWHKYPFTMIQTKFNVYKELQIKTRVYTVYRIEQNIYNVYFLTGYILRNCKLTHTKFVYSIFHMSSRSQPVCSSACHAHLFIFACFYLTC